MSQMTRMLTGRHFDASSRQCGMLSTRLTSKGGFIENRRTGVTLIASDWLAVDDH